MTSEYSEILGSRLQGLRKEHGYTQGDLAEALGVTKATVSRYESGVINNLPRTKVQKLAEMLNVSPAYLMGWSDDTQGVTVAVHVPDSEPTIRRQGLTPQINALSAQERDLVKAFRKLNKQDRANIMAKVTTTPKGVLVEMPNRLETEVYRIEGRNRKRRTSLGSRSKTNARIKTRKGRKTGLR